MVYWCYSTYLLQVVGIGTGYSTEIPNFNQRRSYRSILYLFVLDEKDNVDINNDDLIKVFELLIKLLSII